MEIFIMAESHLISQLTKLIESSYKEKAILEHQLEQLKQQKSDLEDKIFCFENTLIYIEPDFDLRQIKTQFNISRLIKPRLFKQNLQLLVARVLKQSDSWKTLYFITEASLELDTGKDYPLPQKEHELAVARVLKELYKKGIIERKEVELHKRIQKRRFFRRSEWRLKPLE
jgi:hypothetical protein